MSPIHSIMHELAEGLQATGSYLSAVQQVLRKGAATDDPPLEVVERALAQWLRAQHAFRELRSCMAEQPGMRPD